MTTAIGWLRGALLAAGLTLTLSLAARARAEPTASTDVEPIRAQYAVHPGCPDRESFVGQVLARTPRARRASDHELARTFVIRISPNGSSSRGVLTLSGPDSDEAAREVTAQSCSDVVSALALIAALVIDPEASTSPLAQSPTTPVGDEPSSAPPPLVGPDRGIVPSAPALAGQDDEHLSLTAALAAELMGGVAPSPVLLPRSSLELTWQRASLFAPSARLSVGRGQTDARVGNLGTAEFVWVSGRLELCPIAVSPTERATFRPCAAFEAGAVTAEGSAIAQPREETRPLMAAAVLGRVSFFIAQMIGIELYGGATAPLVHDEYVFIDRSRPASDQAVSAHTVPVISGFAGIAIALRTSL